MTTDPAPLPVVHWLPPRLEERPRKAGKRARQEHLERLNADPAVQHFAEDMSLVTCPVCVAHLPAQA